MIEFWLVLLLLLGPVGIWLISWVLGRVLSEVALSRVPLVFGLHALAFGAASIYTAYWWFNHFMEGPIPSVRRAEKIFLLCTVMWIVSAITAIVFRVQTPKRE